MPSLRKNPTTNSGQISRAKKSGRPNPAVVGRSSSPVDGLRSNAKKSGLGSIAVDGCPSTTNNGQLVIAKKSGQSDVAVVGRSTSPVAGHQPRAKKSGRKHRASNGCPSTIGDGHNAAAKKSGPHAAVIAGRSTSPVDGQMPPAKKFGLIRNAIDGCPPTIGNGHDATAKKSGLHKRVIAGRSISPVDDQTLFAEKAKKANQFNDAIVGRSILIDDIRGWHRKRMFAMNQRKRLDLATGAYLRRDLGWSKDLPKPERDKIAKQAAAIMKAQEHPFVVANCVATGPWEDIEQTAKNHMTTLAENLPVWASFGMLIRGFGLSSLATIIAEAGDLSNYPKHGHLWKRLGLAVMDGQRQGDPLIKTAEEWIRHGYSPRRRSLIWNIGDALIKQNQEGKYRTIYLKRKADEKTRDPEMRPIVAHLRAQRYMEKKLLRDLWNAWKRA